MARSKQTRGKCAFCGRDLTGSGMTRHLQACPQRKEAILEADEGRRRYQPHYHLRVKSVEANGYWLHLEMSGTANFAALDDYLRAIWVECCGHLSRFAIGGPWSQDEVSMDATADRVFSGNDKLFYVYDFGTSTTLEIHVADRREGQSLNQYPIYLMARNDAPAIVCGVCGEPATQLCSMCGYEELDTWALCDAHAEEHFGEDSDHEEYSYLIVNSPRMGECGYSGPAEPPY